MPRKRDWPPCEVDEHGLNRAITVHALDDASMRAAGFTDTRGNTWYYSRNLGDDISFNVSVEKDGSSWRIDILDEMFCQPYDYQSILRHCPTHPIAHRTYEAVEREMERLGKLGIVSGHIPGDYI